MGGKTVSQWYKYTAVSDRPETVNYAKDNLATRYTMSSTRYIDYTYDGLNRLTGKTLSLATPLSYAYTYKVSDRGSGYTTSLISREDIGNKFYKYAYDDLGNITNIVSGTTDENQSSYRRYRYDPLNQLVREDNEASRETYIYVYDAYGNITEKRVYERFFEDEAPADKFKEVITYIYDEGSVAGWSKLLTEYNGENIDYDAIGNPITYRGATLDWDTRELKSYSKNGTEITYKYDANGLRASKTVNGVTTNYQYVSGKLMYEECNGTEKYYFYDSNGVISGIRYFDAKGNMTMIYVVTNALGDVIALYDKNGNAVVEYQYDAWGNIISTTNGDGSTLSGIGITWNEINPFRYRGYYYDSETGLYYLQSRYYDAEVGRFLNADILFSTGTSLLGFNMFAYCNNNPMSFIDLMGLAPEWWQWLISGVMVVGGIALVATGTGGPFGGTLICSGVNSIIGSYTSESNGGSSLGGWTGGLLSGAICGYGAGWAGGLFIKATESIGLSCIYNLIGGFLTSSIYGTVGTFSGQIASNLIDGNPIDIQKTLKSSMFGGTINIFAGVGSALGSACADMYLISTTCKVLSNSLNLYVTMMTEAVCDVLNLVSSFFG